MTNKLEEMSRRYQIKANMKLTEMSIKDLCWMMDQVSSRIDSEGKDTMNAIIIREWILEELKKRNKLAFDAWQESGVDSPTEFYAAY